MAIRDEESAQQRQMIKQLISEITMRGGTGKFMNDNSSSASSSGAALQKSKIIKHPRHQ
jgi:hypothetical protein